MRFGTSTLIALILISAVANGRPLEDIVAEKIREKVPECGSFHELTIANPAPKSRECEIAETIRPGQLYLLKGNMEDPRVVCDRKLQAHAKAEEERMNRAINNSCVIDEFSFVSIGPLSIIGGASNIRQVPAEETKIFNNCTSHSQDYFETVSLTVQSGYKVVLSKAYSKSSSVTSTVTYSDVRSVTETSNDGISTSIGAVGFDNSSGRTTTNTKSFASSRTKLDKVRISLSEKQTQERIETKVETRPEQFSVPKMSQYTIFAKRGVSSATYNFQGKVLVEARIRISDRLRTGKPLGKFTSDGMAYASELLEETERQFSIEGQLIARELKETEITYVEKPLLHFANCMDPFSI